VTKIRRLQEEDLASRSSEVQRTSSGDQSLEDQGKHPQQASVAEPTMARDDPKSGTEDKSASGGHEQDKDRKLLEHLQVLGELYPELQLNGLRDLRLAVQQGRIAELRTQRDLERAFEQTRTVVMDEQLRIAGIKARRRQYQSLLFFGLLIPVAALVAGLLYSGNLADNVALWATAGTVFFMSYAAIIFFAATSLGAFAEMIQLIRMQLQSTEQTSAETTTTGFSSTLSFDDLRDKYSRDS
jgi:ABC-type multidrug transport system fused ATPase/permease subunit